MPTVTTEKLSVVEKIGYSLGDLAANLIFQTLLTFIAYFYTDVYGIPSGPASAIIFFGGILGALFNPIMGLIADRTVTRWGKFRPWILWTAIPFGVISLLTFTTPDLSPKGKLVYAACTYIALVLIYSANNLPYAALSGVMTGNMSERNSLSAYRFVAVMIAQFIIQVLLLPLVLILGGGDKAEGFKNTMLLFSTLGVVCFLVTFATTRERIVPPPSQHNSVRQDLLDLLGNRPWAVMLAATVLVFVTLALKGGMYVYYFNWYADAGALAAFLDRIGFNALIAEINAALTAQGLTRFHWPDDPAASAFSLFNACGIILMIVGIGFSRPLADRYGKRNVFAGALFASTLPLLAFYAIPSDGAAAMFIAQAVHGFTYGITIPLLWAMIADVADYAEWRNGRRATAIVFSAMIFGLKIGLSIGGALVTGILTVYGYDPALPVQNPGTVTGIRLALSVYSALPFLVAVALLFLFYPIDKALEARIEHDLAARRAAA